MNRPTLAVGRALLCAALVSGSLALVTVSGTGSAQASPCGTGQNSSSGSAAIPTDRALGPQRPLEPYEGANTRTVEWLTGPHSANDTFNRFGISGTDLGISWDNGSGQTLMAFGDTFGNCARPGQGWRHNVLLRSNDTDLGDGVYIHDAVPGDPQSGSPVHAGSPHFSRELIPALGFDLVELTTIPTAAIALPRPGGGYRQYINYMSVRAWGDPGHWATNYSAIAYSDDNGQTWTTDHNTLLVNAPIALPLPNQLQALHPNNGKFQQSAYLRGRGDDARYTYQFGTPNGRYGAAFLARFTDIVNFSTYEYWAGQQRGWVNDIATIPDDGSAMVVPPRVTELSVNWSPYLNKYVMLDGDNGIYLRTADRPEGPWSGPQELLPRGEVVVYAPMIHPQSPAITGTGTDLYFFATRWSDYNVMTLQTDLARLG